MKIFHLDFLNRMSCKNRNGVMLVNVFFKIFSQFFKIRVECPFKKSCICMDVMPNLQSMIYRISFARRYVMLLHKSLYLNIQNFCLDENKKFEFKLELQGHSLHPLPYNAMTMKITIAQTKTNKNHSTLKK